MCINHSFPIFNDPEPNPFYECWICGSLCRWLGGIFDADDGLKIICQKCDWRLLGIGGNQVAWALEQRRKWVNNAEETRSSI